ncbi:MAG: hypothetical protein R3B91_10825 [Planctomycetaceae bacterium]
MRRILQIQRNRLSFRRFLNITGQRIEVPPRIAAWRAGSNTRPVCLKRNIVFVAARTGFNGTLMEMKLGDAQPS